MFSSRLPADLTPNAMTLAVARLRAAGTPLLDLTETNPTTVGLSSPPAGLLSLADAKALIYRPEPLGLATAREAVAADYERRGVSIPRDRVMLTASTSEAYAILFKLLCDAGDAVLVPQPSYPLFDLLTSLEGVEARPYRLDRHGAWSIDRASVEAALSPRTRAILVVSPNNPTGSMLRASDRDWLVSLAADCGIALISDEVFIDYPIAPRSDASSLAGESRALTFVLGGLSKSAGLPQVKLGWTIVSGPADLVELAMSRLEVICDAYLSVSTPVQHAAGRLIESGRTTRAAIQERIRENIATLERLVARWPAVTLLSPEGGWSAVLQVPSTAPEETMAMRLLEDAHVLAHPGYFFDFPREAFFVVSLLPGPAIFGDAITRMLDVVGVASIRGPRAQDPGSDQ